MSPKVTQGGGRPGAPLLTSDVESCPPPPTTRHQVREAAGTPERVSPKVQSVLLSGTRNRGPAHPQRTLSSLFFITKPTRVSRQQFCPGWHPSGYFHGCLPPFPSSPGSPLRDVPPPHQPPDQGPKCRKHETHCTKHSLGKAGGEETISHSEVNAPQTSASESAEGCYTQPAGPSPGEPEERHF